MDDDALNMRNWGYYEPTFKGHLGLQLMSSMADRDTKPFLPGRDPNSSSVMIGANGSYHNHNHHHHHHHESPVVPMSYGGREWVSQREKMLNIMPQNQYSSSPNAPNLNPTPTQNPNPNPAISEASMQMVEEPPEMVSPKESGPSSKKRQSSNNKGPKVKKPRKAKDSSSPLVPRLKAPKKSLEVVINGIDMDISGIPIPVCSCTGQPQQCYRWGCGGWQSACCTTNVSVYPLPMSTKRRGARIAGRKMSQGAFKKVLEKLAAEGYNFASPIDLRAHWARHGTNKFVTIR